MDSATVYTLIAAISLSVIHIFAGRLRFLEGIPRSKWLSGAGGVSVAYVFIHIFPELKEGQEKISEGLPSLFSLLEHHVYLLSLVGFIAFYSLERYVKTHGSQKKTVKTEEESSAGVFWVHIVSFAIYNGLIGYLLLHREEITLLSVAIFFFAMALHFLVNDFGLREHHREKYDHAGRWILSSAIVLGWVIGLIVDLDIKVITTLFAFLAGGIILNVMKEELPEDRKSNSTAFLLGSIGYALLLLSL